jgi:uncharacterized membrane protein YsdA (DUF1294 family)
MRDIPAWPALVGLAVALLVGVIIDTKTTGVLLVLYLVMSAATFVAYAADKAAAQAGRFRTQESALHLMELFFGWPGALLAQRALRHKTIKRSYQLAFWACVVVNIVGTPLIVWFIASIPGS